MILKTMGECVVVDADRHINSVQEQGVMATIKHLVGNEQEMWRMYNPFQPAYSANIGQYC